MTKTTHSDKETNFLRFTSRIWHESSLSSGVQGFRRIVLFSFYLNFSSFVKQFLYEAFKVAQYTF
jgi:hypothetical protein